MHVLLLKDIPSVGRKGQVVTVSDGYAKNALIPKKWAQVADANTIATYHARIEREEKNTRLKKDEYKRVAPLVAQHTFSFSLKTGESGQLFESLHVDSVAKEILKFIYSLKAPLIDAHDIVVNTKPIKSVGNHTIPVSIGRGEGAVLVNITVSIVPHT